MLREAKQFLHAAGAAAAGADAGPVDVDRVAMGLAGGLLAWYGITRFTFGGLLAAGIGSGLVCRSVHGDWRVLHTLGLTSEGDDAAETRSPASGTRRTRSGHGARSS